MCQARPPTTDAQLAWRWLAPQKGLITAVREQDRDVENFCLGDETSNCTLAELPHSRIRPAASGRYPLYVDICYVSNELFNTVCVAQLDASNPDALKARLVPIQYESTLDRRDGVSYVSEIRLSPDARYLYVSNRGDNSLAIFKVLPDGRLERAGLVPTGGKFPRHFAITPDGKAVIVANQDSGHIRVFARDVETGALEMTDEVSPIPAPNYIRFVYV